MRALLQQAANRLHAFEDHLTVRTQIAAAVAAMSIVLVGTLAAGAALISYRNTAALIENNLAGTASMVSGRLDRFMATRRQEMKLFAELQPMEQLWQGDPAALRSSLEALQHSFDFAWIGFADVNGNVVAATGGMLQGKSVAARPWFKQGLERVAVGDVHEALLLASLLMQRANNEPYRFVDIAVPVRDAGGKLLGVLGGHLDWNWATSLIKDVEANDGNADATLSIISKDGMTLVGPQKETIRYSGDDLAAILKAGDGTFRETRDGQQMLTAFHVGSGYRDYQGLNWIVTASQPASVALKAAIASAQMILAIGAATALIALSLAVLVSRRIAAPIIAFTQEADRIGRAHGPTMLARQSGSAEVVQLSRALRSLLRRIGLAEERTKEAELRATENAMQLQEDMLKLRHLADTDFMTGLMNRRSFLAVADDTVAYCRRYKRNMATLMIDIDHFKKINDTHGHAAGDDAIKRVAEIVSQSIRTTDKAARFGGEEFVVLLREIDQETAILLADRIRTSIESARVTHENLVIPITVSVGLALFDESDRDVQDIIERADQGLYVAKKTGRNRIFLMPAEDERAARAA
ncbi:sensor domain-containing diguanylate cyclase [Bradyrhizobium japonicum]|uniref:diguanylate cyclase n=1 Tax=Bradyrhizobium japonicum TaxID=375 RepID=A0ABV2S5K5_BRAJP|nr:diguanylate cyclase [Bradyrhizobium japonicum]MCP1759047.1 diguanylate cyclase (GGDEF)-like protein [Bradyrhizobium japonicum]MCP1790556.1 diguanylate cyclase (GGDEF)-like protein [Bradyrhizobium japonicum]MCP1803053.1 diguanylate cyclase (GGDEF)-like protein [Bradyrhizobium japonicum]MCP1811990.1 diguanylate cyclase (GGDEF)-like protein [Bradyrhizobium japonicum]MCP1867129.1 diguanylate cyclase (GGDEF)-like protein [Bradyrhizobium japonicum]